MNAVAEVRSPFTIRLRGVQPPLTVIRKLASARGLTLRQFSVKRLTTTARRPMAQHGKHGVGAQSILAPTWLIYLAAAFSLAISAAALLMLWFM
jgi:hypothetical protein